MKEKKLTKTAFAKYVNRIEDGQLDLLGEVPRTTPESFKKYRAKVTDSVQHGEYGEYNQRSLDRIHYENHDIYMRPVGTYYLFFLRDKSNGYMEIYGVNKHFVSGKL